MVELLRHRGRFTSRGALRRGALSAPRAAPLLGLELLERVHEAAADPIAFSTGGPIGPSEIRHGQAGAGATLGCPEPLDEVEHELLIVIPLAGPTAGTPTEAPPGTPPTEHLRVEPQLPRVDEDPVALGAQDRLVLDPVQERTTPGTVERPLGDPFPERLMLFRLDCEWGATVSTDHAHPSLEVDAVGLVWRIVCR